jgi:TonB-linked SusC/RagA family outer membrane protein
LTWNKNFGKHHFDALAGHESYKWDYYYLGGSRSGMDDRDLVLNNYLTLRSLSGYHDKYRLESYLSRVNYSYDDKYFGSVSLRRDGSSKFHADSRWGTFWSIGGGWRLDKEQFFKGISEIQMLKLRSSYGQVGNDAGIDYYVWQATYDMGPTYNNAGEVGALQGSLGGVGLTWESSNNFDLAVEFGLKTGIRGHVEFFNRQSNNLLFDVPIPMHYGLPSASGWQNIGTMYNRGIEVDVSYTLRKGDFSWTPRLVLTHFKNQITKLTTDDPDEAISLSPRRLKVGHSIYDFWLRQWHGVDPADGRALYVWDPEAANARAAANIRVIGTDTFALNPAVALEAYSGSAIPKISGGITNTFTYKNFDLSILLTYSVGGKLLDRIYTELMTVEGNAGGGKHMHKDLLGAWKQPGDISDIPRVDDFSNSFSWGNTSNSTRWLTSSSYLQLRAINLGYSVPRDYTRKIGLSGARVYFSAENLAMFCARQGMNPIQRFSGTVSNDDAYTPAKTIMFGINVNF